jgi:hypothetical protein
MKTTITSLAGSLALASIAATAFAQAGANSHQTLIYGGQPLDMIGAHATSWGGGVASDHDGDGFTTAGHAVHIETAGLFQGGEITLDTPVSLGNLKSDPTRYLQIIFSADPSTKYPQATVAVQSNGPAGYPGMGMGRPGVDMQGAPRGGGGTAQGYGTDADPHFKFVGVPFQIAQGYGGPPAPSGRPVYGAGAYGGPGGPNPYAGGPMMPGAPMPAADDTSALPNIPITELHVVLVFDDGSRAEMIRPISLSVGDDVTWLRAGIALAAIPVTGGEASNAQLKKILIGSDVPAILNVGEIRLVSDTTPITADAGKSETIPAGSSVTLVGTGEGGASALKYEWDFDSPDTFVTQAEGVKVSHIFDKAGDYTVTLKVSDVDGIKQPATSTVVIHVNDQGPTTSMGAPGYGGPPPGYGGPMNPPANFGAPRN